MKNLSNPILLTYTMSCHFSTTHTYQICSITQFQMRLVIAMPYNQFGKVNRYLSIIWAQIAKSQGTSGKRRLTHGDSSGCKDEMNSPQPKKERDKMQSYPSYKFEQEHCQGKKSKKNSINCGLRFYTFIKYLTENNFILNFCR